MDDLAMVHIGLQEEDAPKRMFPRLPLGLHPRLLLPYASQRLQGT